jgi:hypothetical protein
MNAYEIKYWNGGLSDEEDKGIRGAFKFGSNLNIRKQVDSLSCGQALVDEGLASSHSPSLSVSPSLSMSRSNSPSPSASPSETPSPTASPSASASPTPSVSISASPSTTASSSVSPSPSPTAGLTTVFEGLIHFFVKCTDGYTYGFDNTGCIYRRDTDSFWQRVYKDENGAIKGAEEKPSATTTYLYWATDRVLKRKEIPGLDNWNDVEEVNNNLDSADWHTMKQIGGALKIANQDKLALVGYDDSYTNEALDLIPGNLAKTIVERDGRAIVGTYKAADPNKGINGAVDAEYPLAQVGDDGDIYFANMSDSMPVKRFPGGGKVNPGGVANQMEQVEFFEWEETALSWIDKQSVGNMALFGVYDADEGKGGVYSLGRKNKNNSFTLNLDYLLDVDEIGAITTVDGVVLISYRDGSDFGVKAVDSTAKAQGIYEGLDLYAKSKKTVNITNWKSAEILMSPLPNGASVDYYYKMDKAGDWVRAKTVAGGTSYNTALSQKAVFVIGSNGEIFSHKIVLNPVNNDSPEIYRERVFFD